MKNLVIVGNGGFAREVEWLVERINSNKPTWNLLGFVDNNHEGMNVIGNDEFVVNYPDDLYVAIAIGSSKIRKRIFEKYKENSKIRFANLIDPSVCHSKSVYYGVGNIICAGTILTVNINLGNCNIINLDCTVGHDSIISDFVTVNPSVNISGNTVLYSGVNIGTGTQIIQGCSIGEYCIVGAGAVVNRDLPANCTAVGIPAKVIKYHDE